MLIGLLIINNLPKGDCVKKDNFLTYILISGPDDPCSNSMQSVLASLIAKLLSLDPDLHALDVWLKARFILKAYLISILPDMIAVWKMLLFQGSNAIKLCRVCNITGMLTLFSVLYPI